MMLNKRVRCLAAALAASAVIAFSLPALAQDVSESHLKAAHEAISALHATDPFDNILPAAAAGLQQQLIQKNPDMEQLISTTISEKALALASRRADLENEAATAYAKSFSEQELKDIAAFYSSPSGKKLLETGPIATRELVKAAEIWQNGIARDLAQQVGEALAAASKTKAPAAPADGTAAPADDAAKPADSGNGG
ncbi:MULTISPECIES: DUF2059 domain-containing protein [Phyllobacteriaceae]|jgi:hypothetical protein|uniref:DUF2059 domain-containing protein n=1 Tax=Ollibium composti TaxID=2675109 RepID=A0ABY2QCA9_9HYPH|nr:MULTISPECIES: DUF2059 domain-containing protein [Mesorhizobium]QDB99659.1 DUF2059 domain-containing protein [Mesorhizobium sp. 8]THF59921.1 DUF2059 domain-containing protein [Mesorhizobium composti]